MAVLLATAACQSVGATTLAPRTLPGGPLLDCTTIAKVHFPGESERMPEHSSRSMNPFSTSPCGGLFDILPNRVVFTQAHAGSYEHSAIRAVWSQVDAMWNARDAEGFSRLFAEDVSFTFVQRGQSLDDRASILEHFDDRFPHFARDLRHRTRIGVIHAIAPGIFTADGSVEIVRHADGGDAVPTVLRRFAIFAVMSRQHRDWTIRMLRIYQLSMSIDDED